MSSKSYWGMGLLLLGAAAACGGDTSDRGSGAGGLAGADFGNAGAAGSANAGTGFSNAGASANAGMNAQAMDPVAGTSGEAGTGEPLGEGNACGVGMVSAELTPVNMLVMFDRSRSMLDNDKWPNATAALTSFIEDPGADGLRVALRFFPHDEPAAGCTEDGCDAQACAEPLVAIGTLLADPAPADAHEAALVSAIVASAPPSGGGGGGGGGQGTPIYAALDGALRWAVSDLERHPEESTVVVFVTDGEPNGCDEDFDHISALAADAFQNHGILTFAIGLEGSSEQQMDQLAQAGGTDSGIFISNSANAEAELLAALDAIRGLTLSCDFAIPAPMDPSMPIDLSKVNVTFTPSSGMAATLPQVADAAACSTSSAWHYDAATDPTRIVLCPAACELARSDADAELQVLLGCNTCGGLDIDCGSDRPPDLPPLLVD